MKNPNKLFPLIVTSKLAETKKFYLQQADFEVVIEVDGYLQVRSSKDESAPELCFMAPGAMPEGPEFPVFDGKGLVMSIPTPSADEKAQALRNAGVKDVAEATNKPWGWRSFIVPDPNGVLLDFFHVVEEKRTSPQA